MKRHPHIMVVDDDQGMRGMLNRNLQLEGYGVVMATDGSSALTMLEKHRPDLVILDTMMPQLDGFQALNLVRQCSNVPIIMLTADCLRPQPCVAYFTVIRSTQKLISCSPKDKKIGSRGFKGGKLAPRINVLFQKREELQQAKADAEEALRFQAVGIADPRMVRHYVDDLRGLLERSSIVEQRSFLKSFVERIEVDDSEVRMYCTILFQYPLIAPQRRP